MQHLYISAKVQQSSLLSQDPSNRYQLLRPSAHYRHEVPPCPCRAASRPPIKPAPIAPRAGRTSPAINTQLLACISKRCAFLRKRSTSCIQALHFLRVTVLVSGNAGCGTREHGNGATERGAGADYATRCWGGGTSCGGRWRATSRIARCIERSRRGGYDGGGQEAGSSGHGCPLSHS